MTGPDVDGLRRLADETGAPLIASGGVSSLDDIRALAVVPGLAGVIAGKAIYEGRLDVAAAVGALS
jgi:phosphoribosylformimino-5-aminoimidazole carboxamide ribonucleotide (ProFAR) isomerase